MKRGRPKGRSNDKKSYGPLGDLIRRRRIERGLGLMDVAKSCRCSVQFISNIEHGRAPLPWEKAELLAKFLELPLEELHAANLAIRSDFKSFIINTGTAPGLARGQKGKLGRAISAATGPLREARAAAALVAVTAQDSLLREIIQRYQAATPASKKRFYQSAKKLLGTTSPGTVVES